MPLRAAGQAAARAADRRGASGSARRARGRSTCASSRRPTPTSRAEVAAGRFREDLLYRLNTIEIHLPPLRERREDIAAARRALPRALRRRATASRSRGFDARARCSALAAHAWPGNVRELEHASSARCCWRRATQHPGGGPRAARAPASAAARLEDLTLEEVERVLIQKALARHDGNVSHAAKALGLTAARSTGGCSIYGL